MTKKQSIAVNIVTLLIGIALMLVIRTTITEAASTYCSGPVECPVYTSYNSGSYFYGLTNGSSVGMVCWKDSQWHTVNYSSNRWFRGSNPIVGTQWFHSSAVFNQVSVPAC